MNISEGNYTRNTKKWQGIMVSLCLCTTSWQPRASTALGWAGSRNQSWRQQSFLPCPCTALVRCVNSLSNIPAIRMCTRQRGKVDIWSYKGHTAGRKIRHSGRQKHQENYEQRSVTQPLQNQSRHLNWKPKTQGY